MSDHPVALFYDMCISYCAVAWVSVVIMSVSVIDAHFRENEAMDNAIGTAKLLDDYYEGEDIKWLRKLRNSYVHLNINNPTLDLSMIDGDRIELEENATKAFKMTVKALFQNPWIQHANRIHQ